jgi:hypothetical protein
VSGGRRRTQDNFRRAVVAGRNDGRVVLVLERCAAKVDENRNGLPGTAFTLQATPAGTAQRHCIVESDFEQPGCFGARSVDWLMQKLVLQRGRDPANS